MKRNLLFVSAWLVLSLLAAGCGGPEALPKVTGKVTVGGMPAAGETVTLRLEASNPEDSYTKSIAILADGSFSGALSMPGTYKVFIQPSRAAMEGRGKASDLPIPEKYRTLAGTDLVWVIEKGLNKREFDLKE